MQKKKKHKNSKHPKIKTTWPQIGPPQTNTPLIPRGWRGGKFISLATRSPGPERRTASDCAGRSVPGAWTPRRDGHPDVCVPSSPSDTCPPNRTAGSKTLWSG